MKTKQQEYSDAFNEGPAEGEMGVAADEPSTDQVTGEGEATVGSEASAAGMTDEPAVAVVITGDDEAKAPVDPVENMEVADGEPQSPEEIQRAKSWEGRLKKLEADLRAREAALAEKESSVLQAKDGAKVEGFDPEGEKWNRIKAEAGREDMGGEPGARRTTPVVTYQDEDFNVSGSDYVESDEEADAKVKEFNDGEVVQMAEGGEVEGAEPAGEPAPKTDEEIIAEGLEIYGPEFDGFIAALIRKHIGEQADPIVSSMTEKIDNLAGMMTAGLENMHMSVLDALVDDLEEITASEEFGAWIESLPEEEKGAAAGVIESGTVGQVKRLIAKFAQARESGGEMSPEDVWAEDAATAVKGKSPVRLPQRAPESPNDEYSRAFNAA